MINPIKFIEAITDAHSYSVGEFTLASILQSIERGESRVFNVEDLYAVVCINHYETYKACCIQLCGGTMNMQVLAKGLALVERYAQDMGCSTLEVYGRKGWVRQLKPLGFEETYTVVQKKLEAL